MMRRPRLVLATMVIALATGSGFAAPIDLSPSEDLALRQLLGKAGSAGPGKGDAGGGNPYLGKHPRKPIVPAPRTAPASEPAVDAPMDLLAHPSRSPAARPETAAPAARVANPMPAKKALPPTLSPSASVKAAKIVVVPLPHIRPAGGPVDTAARLDPEKPAADDAVAARVGPKDEPVGGSPEAASPAPIATTAMAAALPAHPPSAYGRPLPEGAIQISDLAYTAPLPAPPPFNAAPYQLLRTLQLLQDQTAQGSAAAFVAERQLRIRIEDAFTKADATVWQDRRNAAAVVTYVLSGGSPAILHHLATLAPAAAIDHRLIDGALAYIEGRSDEASAALAGVEANDLPASMGGQIALAQAALAVADDPQRAMQFLDTARLLAPGTLVEEAALRREIVVADQVGDQAKFESLARQYLGRFRHSVYAGNFRYRFAAILTHLKFGDDSAQTNSLDDIFKDLEPSTARELYLTVARAAVVQGKAKAAALASQRAGALSADGSPDQARAHLYRAAALILLPDGLDGAIAEEKAIRPELLRGSDRSLRDMAAITIEAVAKADKVADKKGGDPAVPQSADPSPIMVRAETALQAADALLQETSR